MDLLRSRAHSVRPPSSWHTTRLTPFPTRSLSGHKRRKNCLRPPSYEKSAAGCLHSLSSHSWVSTGVASRSSHQSDNSYPRNGWNDSRSSTPSFRSNDAFSKQPVSDRGSRSGHVTPDRGGGNRWGGDRPQSAGGWSGPQKEHRGGGGEPPSGYGTWRDGIHIVGGRNVRLEKELFGEPNDPSKQHTGINFEKYDDIPVEATGAGVPDPITTFGDSPLDPALLENITYARYNTPTPVQKYSVPIVAAGRDLMACAQVRPLVHSFYSRSLTFERIRPAQVKPAASSSPFFPLPSPKAPVSPRLMLAVNPLIAPARLTPPP